VSLLVEPSTPKRGAGPTVGPDAKPPKRGTHRRAGRAKERASPYVARPAQPPPPLAAPPALYVESASLAALRAVKWSPTAGGKAHARLPLHFSIFFLMGGI